MITVDIKNIKGEKVGSLKLLDKLFGLELDEKLIRNVFESKRANKRKVIAHTKTRGEVSGGGIKPWAQKGTGRARVGSSRTPVWRKGGIVFGPRSDRNFSVKINKKAGRKALLSILSGKVATKKLSIVDSLELENPKTKLAADVIKNVNAKDSTDALVISNNESKNVSRAFRNLENVKVIKIANINLIDLVSYDGVIFDKAAIESFQTTMNKS